MSESDFRRKLYVLQSAYERTADIESENKLGEFVWEEKKRLKALPDSPKKLHQLAILRAVFDSGQSLLLSDTCEALESVFDGKSYAYATVQKDLNKIYIRWLTDLGKRVNLIQLNKHTKEESFGVFSVVLQCTFKLIAAAIREHDGRVVLKKYTPLVAASFIASFSDVYDYDFRWRRIAGVDVDVTPGKLIHFFSRLDRVGCEKTFLASLVACLIGLKVRHSIRCVGPVNYKLTF